MSTLDRFDNDTVVRALAAGEDPAILAALAHGPFDGARDAWGLIARDDWDTGSPSDSAFAALWDICTLLTAWESPEWGNTGGRYDYSPGAGGLSSDAWDALAAGTYAEHWESQDSHDAHGVQALHDYLTESDSHLAHVVHLGDMLSQVIDRCRALGGDY